MRPFGLLYMGPTAAGQTVEIQIGFSLRDCDQARRNLYRECGEDGTPAFDTVLTRTRARWRDHLGRVEVEGGSPARRQVFATALYHSLVVHIRPEGVMGGYWWVT